MKPSGASRRGRRGKKPTGGKLGKAAEKFVEVVDQATYAEHHYFSDRNVIWRRFDTKKPRMPTDADRENKWTSTLFQPPFLNTFFGTQNKKVITTFSNIRDKFENTGQFPTLFILSGAAGSGKTALVEALLNELCACIGVDKKTSSDFILQVDCEVMEVPRMWGKVNDYAKGTPSVRVPYKFVVIDGADHITPTQQQVFKKLFKETENNTKYIIICRSLAKLTGHMLAKGPQYTANVAVERDALGFVLRILQKERIGFNREGIEYAFKHGITEMNLRLCIEIMQETFLTYNFLSQENVEKVILKRTGKRPEISVPASRAVEPLKRCNICTLVPPCEHITIRNIEAQAEVRRKELPIYKGGMTCYNYLKYGVCKDFNKYGHCSLNHPRKLHKLIIEPERCPQCSLVWPCHHCAFSAKRDALIDTVQKLEERLHLLKQIAVEAPPIALTSHLAEEFPNYPRQLLRLRKMITLEKEVSLKKTVEWIESSTCIIGEEYAMKDKMLQVTFTSLLTSRLLDPPETFMKKDSSSDEETQAAGGDDDSDDDDDGSEHTANEKENDG